MRIDTSKIKNPFYEREKEYKDLKKILDTRYMHIFLYIQISYTNWSSEFLFVCKEILTYSMMIFSTFSSSASIKLLNWSPLWSHLSATHIGPLLRDTFVKSSPMNLPTKPWRFKLRNTLFISDNGIAPSSIECATNTNIRMHVKNLPKINNASTPLDFSSGLLSYSTRMAFLWHQMWLSSQKKNFREIYRSAINTRQENNMHILLTQYFR